MFKNVFGFSFYAQDIAQANKSLMECFGKAEAILFSREDLELHNWEKAWENIKKVVDIMGSDNVTFHFPMDNCDYVNDIFVRNRLIDAIKKSKKLKIKKIVIHPNVRYSILEWKNVDREIIKNKIFTVISEILANTDKSVKLCLENMPPIGNRYDDIDGAILFTEDIVSDIDYTWDICHFFNVVQTMNISKSDKRWDKVLNRKFSCDFMSFEKHLDNIKHFHFSAFKDIANPFTKTECKEGVLPYQSIVDEKYYIEAMKIIYNNSIKKDKSIIFEISEKNYHDRKEIIKMLEWAKTVVINKGGVNG